MKKTNNKKGFTIIELIVVIAIIAVLAAIVLVNVTSYINKGKNAAIKGNLASLLTNSAQFYDGISSYTAFCADPKATGPRDAIMGVTGLAASNYTSNSIYYSCNVKSDNTAFCACSQELPTGTTAVTFCVDSSGLKREYTTATDCATKCTTGGACI